MSALTWAHGGGSGNGEVIAALWMTVMVYAGIIVVLVLLGYLIFASHPSEEHVSTIVWGGLVCSFVWPAALTAIVLAGVVLGTRKLVHRQVRPKPTREDLQAKIDRLERELGVTP